MYKYKSLNKNGFSHVEIIIFAVVVLAIGGIGYYALTKSSAQKTTPRQSTTAVTNIETNSAPPTINPYSGLPASSADPEIAFRTNFIKKAQVEVDKAVLETKDGIETDYSQSVFDYVNYTTNGAVIKAVNSVPKVCYGKVADPNRNNAMNPTNWSAEFVSYVYNQATQKTDFKACTGGGLYAIASAKGAVSQIVAGNPKQQPKPGDIVFVSPTGKPNIYTSYTDGAQRKIGDKPDVPHYWHDLTSNGKWTNAQGKKIKVTDCNTLTNVITGDQAVYATKYNVNYDLASKTSENGVFYISLCDAIAKAGNNVSGSSSYNTRDGVRFITAPTQKYKYYIDIYKVYKDTAGTVAVSDTTPETE